MRINTFIVILLVTFIICNNNNHIKGKGKENRKLLGDPPPCAATWTDPLNAYKEITGIATDKSFVNKKFIVYVVITDDAHKYTYYSYGTKAEDKTNVGRYTFTTVAKLDYTLTNDAISLVHNYEFPWTTTSATINTFSFGSVANGLYAADCTPPTKERMINLLAGPDVATVAKYENIDQYKESNDEVRNPIDADVIGDGVMLSRVDATEKINYNIFLSKTQFCHFKCSDVADATKVECDLLVYVTANYKSKVVNLASIIGVTGTAKSFKTVKADTTTVVDTCAGAGTKDEECTKPQYTIMSKGTGKILTAYFKDKIEVKDKYLVSTSSSPKMPAGIQAKFADYKFCFKEPEVQGVSNMFINSILLILIVILMI